jgi:hypothetical protein
MGFYRLIIQANKNGALRAIGSAYIIALFLLADTCYDCGYK